MIYLIGGPPRCGKTILAKAMAKKLGISWISTDMLEVVSGKYITQAQWNKTHPYSYIRRKCKTNDAFYEKLSLQEIVTAIKQQAKATAAAIEMAVIYAIKDETDYIIEGYHIEPKLVSRLTKTYSEKKYHRSFCNKK